MSYAILQRFRDGREKQITTRPTRKEANRVAKELAEEHAAVYGSGHTRVVKLKSRPTETPGGPRR